VLQRGNECQLDRLPRLRHFGRVGRERLDPGHLRQRVQVGGDRLLRGAEIHRPGAALASLEHVEADVRRDPVEPRAKRRAALEVVEVLPGAQERLLDRVLGLEGRPEHPVAVRGQLATVLLELAEGRRGSGGRALHPPHRRGSRSLAAEPTK
jgi:hypothetical protein